MTFRRVQPQVDPAWSADGRLKPRRQPEALAAFPPGRSGEERPRTAWTIADIWEAIAGRQPDVSALVHGDDAVSWERFSERSDALAANLVGAGLRQQSRVAVNLVQGRWLLEGYFAAFKAGVTPVDADIDPSAERILALYQTARVEAVLFDARYGPLLASLRSRLPGVRRWVVAPSPGQAAPAWADQYADIVLRSPLRRPFYADWDRSPDDPLLFCSTGPSGALSSTGWTQDQLVRAIETRAEARFGAPAVSSATDAALRAGLTGASATSHLAAERLVGPDGPGPALAALILGGRVIVQAAQERQRTSAGLPGDGSRTDRWQPRAFPAPRSGLRLKRVS